jgi:hypothetical protein
MARAAKKTPAKERGSAKAATRPATQKRAPTNAKTTQKRTSKTRSQKQTADTGTLLNAVSNLAGSALGREIIADVLEAAAGALRKQRVNVGRVIGAGAEQVSEAAGTAADVATEAVAGTVGLAQAAAGVLAEVVTDAAQSVLPGSSTSDNGRGKGRGRGRSGSKAKS